MVVLIYTPSSVAAEKKNKFLTCLYNLIFEEKSQPTSQIKQELGQSNPQSNPLLARQIKQELDQGKNRVSYEQYDKVIDQVLTQYVPQMYPEDFTKVALDIIKNRSGSANKGGLANFNRMRKVFSLIQKHSQSVDLSAAQIKQIRDAMHKENVGELLWQDRRRDKGIDAFIGTTTFGKPSHINSQSTPTANLIQVWTELDQGKNRVSRDQYDTVIDQVLTRHVPQMNAEQFTKVALDIITNRSASANNGGFADFNQMAKVFGLIQKHSQSVDLSAAQIGQIRAAMRKENSGELMWQLLNRDKDIDDFIDTAPFGRPAPGSDKGAAKASIASMKIDPHNYGARKQLAQDLASTQGKDSDEALMRLASDPNEQVAKAALKSLGSRKIQTLDNFDYSSLINPKDSWARKHFAEALAFAPGKKADEALMRLAADPNENVASAALESLSNRHVQDLGDFDFPSLINREESLARRHLAESLAFAQGSKVDEALTRLAADTDEGTAKAALHSIKLRYKSR